MKDTPVKTAMSPLEIAVWAAEFVRVRGDSAADPSSHLAMGAAIEHADRAIIDLREALGVEHITLKLAELGEDHKAKLAVWREHLTKEPDIKFESIDPDDHHMTWERFVESCKIGSFIDYDGSGDLATATQVSDVSVRPSEIVGNDYSKPAWATHVVWYNK